MRSVAADRRGWIVHGVIQHARGLTQMALDMVSGESEIRDEGGTLRVRSLHVDPHSALPCDSARWLWTVAGRALNAKSCISERDGRATT